MNQNQRYVYVLDTNALINSPDCLTDTTFNNADLRIPEVVLVELDRFKKEDTARGFSARRLGRILNQMRGLGNLGEGVELPNGNILKIESANGETEEVLIDHWDPHDPDHLILKVADKIAKVLGSARVFLVTSDLFLSIKADSIGIQTREVAIHCDPLYTGQREIVSHLANFDETFARHGDWELSPSEMSDACDGSSLLNNLRVNEFLVIRSKISPQNKCLARFNGEKIVPLQKPTVKVVRPRSIAQHFMVNSLIVPNGEERLVIIEGPAGTGKTLLALSAGIEQTTMTRFDKFFFTRANSEADETMGFLPGDISEKMDWLVAPVYDNINICAEKQMRHGSDSLDEKKKLLEEIHISPTPLSHMRGRSLNDSFIMVDEAQNLTREQIKMVISRAGHNSVVVLIGDTSQIDTRGLNPFNNGLTQAFEAMDGESICYRLRLDPTDNRRSRLSQIATERFKF